MRAGLRPSAGYNRCRSTTISASRHASCGLSSGSRANIAKNLSRPGMRTSEPSAGERIKAVRIDEDSLSVDLADGRTVTTPLVWYPRLLHATAQQRSNFQLIGAGYGIHWPDVDEDLSVQIGRASCRER